MSGILRPVFGYSRRVLVYSKSNDKKIAKNICAHFTIDQHWFNVSRIWMPGSHIWIYDSLYILVAYIVRGDGLMCIQCGSLWQLHLCAPMENTHIIIIISNCCSNFTITLCPFTFVLQQFWDVSNYKLLVSLFVPFLVNF